MRIAKPSGRIALALAGAALAATAGGAVLWLRRRKGAVGHADSIEPRTMPGSAADIHVGSARPVDVPPA